MAKGDVAAVAGCLRYYGGWADKIEGKVIDTNPDTFSYTRQEPVSLSTLYLQLPFCSSPILYLTDSDWCLRSNYPMELPIAHAGMEDWSRPCDR